MGRVGGGSGLALQDVWQEEDSKIDIDETERRTGYSNERLTGYSNERLTGYPNETTG
jgi:phage FluMu gp28-like protein